jgi:hypothetical protein
MARRETTVDLVFVREDPVAGGVDMLHLRQLLELHVGVGLKIGAMTAASNLTGGRDRACGGFDPLCWWGGGRGRVTGGGFPRLLLCSRVGLGLRAVWEHG